MFSYLFRPVLNISLHKGVALNGIEGLDFLRQGFLNGVCRTVLSPIAAMRLLRAMTMDPRTTTRKRMTMKARKRVRGRAGRLGQSQSW